MIDTLAELAGSVPPVVWLVLAAAVAIYFREGLLSVVDSLVGVRTALGYLVVVAAGVLFGRLVLPDVLSSIGSTVASLGGALPW